MYVPLGRFSNVENPFRSQKLKPVPRLRCGKMPADLRIKWRNLASSKAGEIDCRTCSRAVGATSEGSSGAVAKTLQNEKQLSIDLLGGLPDRTREPDVMSGRNTVRLSEFIAFIGRSMSVVHLGRGRLWCETSVSSVLKTLDFALYGAADRSSEIRFERPKRLTRVISVNDGLGASCWSSSRSIGVRRLRLHGRVHWGDQNIPRIATAAPT